VGVNIYYDSKQIKVLKCKILTDFTHFAFCVIGGLVVTL
jgi:hypothetical protein